MGEDARRAYLKRATAGESFDHGLELSERMIDAVLERAAIPSTLSPEERAKRAFRVLREAGA